MPSRCRGAGFGPPTPRSRAAALILLPLLASGCRQWMHDQPKYTPLEYSEFFEDGRSARPVVEGTVAQGYLREDSAFFTGAEKGAPIAQLPVPVTRALLGRGQERYNIFCSPCHDRTGGGLGMIVRRGFRRPPSYHIDRLRQAAPGYMYDVIANGFGAMPDYKEHVPPADRWAIVAYIQALQLSQNMPAAELTPESRALLEKGAP
jgi:mono/diheme cytochrome c family protein